MQIRGILEPALRPGSRWLWLVVGGVALSCVLVPGLGALAAFLWILTWMFLGGQPWPAIGLRRPDAPTFALALGLAVVIYAFAEFLMDPLLERRLDAEIDTSSFANMAGDWKRFLGYLLSGWLIGGLLEETVFRGFLVTYGERLFGAGAAWPMALFGAVLFGFSHLYQGPVGMISTGVLGLIFAAIYLRSGRNLTLAILTHGLVDTIYFTLAFTGLREIHQVAS